MPPQSYNPQYQSRGANSSAANFNRFYPNGFPAIRIKLFSLGGKGAADDIGRPFPTRRATSNTGCNDLCVDTAGRSGRDVDQFRVPGLGHQCRPDRWGRWVYCRCGVGRGRRNFSLRTEPHTSDQPGSDSHGGLFDWLFATDGCGAWMADTILRHVAGGYPDATGISWLYRVGLGAEPERGRSSVAVVQIAEDSTYPRRSVCNAVACDCGDVAAIHLLHRDAEVDGIQDRVVLSSPNQTLVPDRSHALAVAARPFSHDNRINKYHAA